MTIRNGIYTEYEQHVLKLVESRNDVPIPVEQKKFQIWFEGNENCPFHDFEKSAFGNGFFKTVTIDQIENAFLILTYGKYKNRLVEVFPGKKENHLIIATRDNLIADELAMKKIGKHWFNSEVLALEIEVIWEEVTQVKHSKNLYGKIIALEYIWKTKI